MKICFTFILNIFDLSNTVELKFDLQITCASSCCCTDGGCNSVEASCQSSNWYFDSSLSSTVVCTPDGCISSPCTIDPMASPATNVIQF
jgi:hypothetical protein